MEGLNDGMHASAADVLTSERWKWYCDRYGNYDGPLLAVQYVSVMRGCQVCAVCAFNGRAAEDVAFSQWVKGFAHAMQFKPLFSTLTTSLVVVYWRRVHAALMRLEGQGLDQPERLASTLDDELLAAVTPEVFNVHFVHNRCQFTSVGAEDAASGEEGEGEHTLSVSRTDMWNMWHVHNNNHMIADVLQLHNGLAHWDRVTSQDQSWGGVHYAGQTANQLPGVGPWVVTSDIELTPQTAAGTRHPTAAAAQTPCAAVGLHPDEHDEALSVKAQAVARFKTVTSMLNDACVGGCKSYMSKYIDLLERQCGDLSVAVGAHEPTVREQDHAGPVVPLSRMPDFSRFKRVRRTGSNSPGSCGTTIPSTPELAPDLVLRGCRSLNGMSWHTPSALQQGRETRDILSGTSGYTGDVSGKGCTGPDLRSEALENIRSLLLLNSSHRSRLNLLRGGPASFFPPVSPPEGVDWGCEWDLTQDQTPGECVLCGMCAFSDWYHVIEKQLLCLAVEHVCARQPVANVNAFVSVLNNLQQRMSKLPQADADPLDGFLFKRLNPSVFFHHTFSSPLCALNRARMRVMYEKDGTLPCGAALTAALLYMVYGRFGRTCGFRPLWMKRCVQLLQGHEVYCDPVVCLFT